METDVLFVTPQFSPDMLKDVIALRSQRPGLHLTLLFGPQWFGQEHLAQEVFDECIVYGESGVVKIISELNAVSAQTTIIRGARGYLDVVVAIFCPGRLIFRSEEWVSAGLNHDPHSDTAQMEKLLVARADGIYHYWDETAAETIREIMSPKGPIITVMPACVEELGPHKYLSKLSTLDGNPHAVFAADVDERDGVPEHLDKWRKMCAQEIHVHYYSPRPNWRNQKIALPYLAFERESSFFHIEPMVDFKLLLVELTQYDWVYLHTEPWRYQMNPGFEVVGSNQMFTYVQAELPLILPDFKIPVMDRLVTEFGTGLAMSNDDFSHIRSLMDSVMLPDLPDRLIQASKASAFRREALANLVVPTSGNEPK